MREVVWSQRALRALDEIAHFISLDDPVAARKVRGRLSEAGDQLGVIATGRPARIKGYFEKSVPRTSHILLYTTREREGREYLVIVDIIDMARNWPKGRMPPA